MTQYAFLGAIEHGLVFSLMALGVFLTFRALDFPDLSVDGSFPLGAAVCAVLITKGVNPWYAVAAAGLAGACAGFVTAFLNTRLKILNLLAGILTMIASYSIILRIMGMPNMPLLGYDTIFTPIENMGFSPQTAGILVFAAAAFLAALFLIWFFHTDMGLALRATGDNMKMVRAQGISTDRMIFIGVSFSNGLVALCGALAAQFLGFADVNMGIGTVVAGLASVIVGEALLSSRSVLRAVVGVILGSMLYRMAIAYALSFQIGEFRFSPGDLNLITAVIVVLALTFPKLRKNIGVAK
ncbi:ABC transporter permease [Seleniivibrio woodruffii]|uniref:Putative ABC transport system permease protein n=1 Tax=Seleniivibrio woodruffii TaxID=1078050 RepID=A0A4R1K5P6_9BACT|nr:ABC transporter permease [Seleniivibrio woodruffii]TCK59502.1 putative ABC transport system permease protein [Seleniivibrio woodruffii]TVZ35457.1 putative ABC transport system permease protein [Seleniivibrio woodruffii]